MGTAQPIKALLDHSPPQIRQDSGHHNNESPSQAAGPEADLTFHPELSTEVVWRSACQNESEASRVASEEKQHQSWLGRNNGQPQLQVGSGRWQDHLSASAAPYEQWEGASLEPTESETGQELSSATSSHLPKFTQVESKFHGNMEAHNCSVHHDMRISDHHLCSSQRSPDRTQHLTQQAHRELLPHPQSHSSALFSQDDQQLDMRSQYLQVLPHQQRSRGAPSAGSRPDSRSSHQAEHLSVVPKQKVQPGGLLSPKQQGSTAGNTVLDRHVTGHAFQQQDEPQHAGAPVCEVLLDGQMAHPSHAAWMTTSEHLDSDARALSAQCFSADSGAGSSQLQIPTAAAALITDPEHPAGPEAPSFSPNKEGSLLGGEACSLSKEQPLLSAAPHSPDRTQPLLGSAPHSPDTRSDAQTSAGNSPAGARKHSRPKASQQASRALQEGLSHPTAMAQGMSNGVHVRPGC